MADLHSLYVLASRAVNDPMKGQDTFNRCVTLSGIPLYFGVYVLLGDSCPQWFSTYLSDQYKIMTTEQKDMVRSYIYACVLHQQSEV